MCAVGLGVEVWDASDAKASADIGAGGVPTGKAAAESLLLGRVPDRKCSVNRTM